MNTSPLSQFKRHSPIALFCALTFFASPVLAQTIWTDGIGDWFNPANWDNGVPTSAIAVQINNGGTAQITAAGASAETILLGHDVADFGALTVSGAGTLTVASDLAVGYGGSGALSISNGGTVSDTSGEIGYSIASGATGASGIATVDGAGSSWTNSFELYVGYGSGTLNVTNGGAVSDQYGYLGYYPESPGRSSGTANIDGAGSSWTSSAGFYVGYGGDGTLNVTDGGTVSNGTGYLGYDYGSTGTATVDGSGSTWTSNGFFYVGNNGSGTLHITNGGKVVSTGSFGYIGYAAASNSSVTIDGPGSIWMKSGGLYAGFDGTGNLDITNGGVLTNGTFFNIGFSVGATGTVTVDGTGSTLNNGTAIAVGGNVSGPGGSGRLTIANGGTVNATSTTVWNTGTLEIGANPTLNSTLTFDGGMLRSVANTTFTNSATLSTGGVVVDSNGFAATWSGALSGAGGLTKNGSGTLTLSGASTYAGATTVNAGALLVNGSIQSSTTVQSGATLGGSGTLGAITLQSGAMLAPGNSPGQLNATSLLWNAGAVLLFELGAPLNSDELHLTGDLTKGSGSEFAFNFLDAGFQVGQTYDLITFGNTNFSASDFSFTNSGPFNGTFAINTTNNTLEFTVSSVPEPRIWALVAGGLILLIAIKRSRVNVNATLSPRLR